MELYKKHRPSDFSNIVGNKATCEALENLLAKNFPKAILFSGPSGCGKTTLARIIKEKLKCSDFDYFEKNSADTRGIDDIRDIARNSSIKSMKGTAKIYVLDEAHKLTNDAQTALLKLLEDGPKDVYFILCTTDPNKLIKTIHTRCTSFQLSKLDKEDIEELVAKVASLEKIKLKEEIAEKIAEASDGSARQALVLLEKVAAIPDIDGQFAAIVNPETQKNTIDLCRAMMNPKVSWKEVADILKKIDDEPETVRRIVLGYYKAVLLNSGRPIAVKVLTAFQYDFFQSGEAGLVLACYNVLHG